MNHLFKKHLQCFGRLPASQMEKPILIAVFFFFGIALCIGQSNLVIVSLAPSKNIFFYERTKYLYPNLKHRYSIHSGSSFKNDTIFLTSNTPNVLVFQEPPSTMIPVFLCSKDTLNVRLDLLNKLIFEGTKKQEWQMMKQLARQYSFFEPYFFNVTFKNIESLQSHLDSIQNEVSYKIIQFEKDDTLSESYMRYLKKELNYKQLASWLYHRNKSLQKIPISPSIQAFKTELLADSLNYGSLFRVPLLYSFIKSESQCYTKDVFPDLKEFELLFNHINDKYEGANRAQLLLNILYEQIVIKRSYQSNKVFFEPYLNSFFSLNKDNDYNDFVKGLLKDERGR